MYHFSSSPLLAMRTPGERKTSLFFDIITHWLIAVLTPVISGLVPGTVAFLVLGFNGIAEIFENGLAARMAGGYATYDTEAMTELMTAIESGKGYRIAELFGTAWGIAAAFFLALVIQRRTIRTLGIERKGAARRYGAGFLFGILLCGATVLISLLTHAVTFEGYQADADYLFLVCVLLGYVIQGAAEELLIHGLFMTTLFRDVKWFPSVIYSSLLFVLMHVTNNGFSLLSSLNVFLFSVFLGLYVIRTGSIFGAAAIHSAWNFLEGHVFGCSVSGFASPGSVFVLTADPTRAVTNGGTFGPEGGLAATMVLMLAIIAVSFIPSIGKNRESAT